MTATPNHALQRTRSGVTLSAACHPAAFAHPAPAMSPQPARRLHVSLSLGSLGGITHMDTISIIPYTDIAHRAKVIALWREVFGYEAAHNKPEPVIDQKVAFGDELFFIAAVGEDVIGTVMAGYDGHRGWIYSVAVSPAHHRRGVGSQLVRFAESALARKGCIKVNLQIMEGNEGVTAFYASLGFSIEKRVSMGKRIHENIPAA